MKISMNLKKEDLMSSALADFWGSSKPEEINTVGMSEDVLTPEDASIDMETEGMTIKERVESGIEATQDLTPDQVAAKRYMMMQKKKPQQEVQRDPFDLGGFDAMIKKQMMRERGMGMSDIGFGGAGMGMGMQPRKQALSYDEKIERELDAIKLKELREGVSMNTKQRRLALQKQRMDLATAAQQQRAMSETERLQKKAYDEDMKRARFAAGLPVKDSAWDYIAGGRQKIQVWDKDAGKMVDKVVRTGGVFGAAKEGYGFYKQAEPHIVSGATKIGKGIAGAAKAGASTASKTAAYTKKATEEFASDAQGVFQVAKTNVGKVGRDIDLKVDSYIDDSGLRKTMDKLIETKPGNRFIDSFMGRDITDSSPTYKAQKETPEYKQRQTNWALEQAKKGTSLYTTIPNIEKKPRAIDRAYEGRNLNPINVVPETFDFSGRTYTPRVEPARVAKTVAPNYNDRMINDVMSSFKNEKSSVISSFVEPPRVAKTVSKNYNDKMINDLMGSMNSGPIGISSGRSVPITEMPIPRSEPSVSKSSSGDGIDLRNV